MHQTCASDSLNLPGSQHINKVCLERHLTEGEVAGVGEPPVVNDRLQKQVQNDSIYVLCDTLLHIAPLDSDTFSRRYGSLRRPSCRYHCCGTLCLPPHPDSLLQCCLVGKPFPFKERFLHGAKEMVVGGGCQVWGCGKAGGGWSGRPGMQCCSWCMWWGGGGQWRCGGGCPVPLSPAPSPP